ncbi:MAG: SUMF1/EgtB/PvdO family nonheme iron enzyme [Gemmatimonadota bacterium]|nr:SUMF1/EgtB/PvdO family nonheme iron enzyme [Bryobacterales bacterium]MDE2876909.1 SUMF1/EgtB/PvdO family nonheme iron enzyme [Gemmatimonadota bacterium]
MVGSESLYSDGPRRRVTNGSPFAVGKYEVTFAEWDACVEGGGCGGYRPPDYGWGRGRQPVIHVSWTDAQAYLEWLSSEAGHEYRLLTAAEWEYVARAGAEEAPPDGRRSSEDAVECPGYAEAELGELHVDCGGHPATVGSLGPNNYGLHDMGGNVWEWIEDCSHVLDGWLPADVFSTPVDCDIRQTRGGSWDLAGRFIGEYEGSGLSATKRDAIVGLRVARRLTDGDGVTTTLLEEGYHELFHWAVGRGEVRIVEDLLGKGVDPDAVVRDGGATPLFSAVYSRSLDAMRVLLEAGADPNIVYEGETPLLSTLGRGGSAGLHQVVIALVNGGADVTARRSDGRTALHLAVEQRHSESILSILLDAGANSDLSALQLASLLNDSLTVASLLAQGMDPDEPDHIGWTALHFAMFEHTPITITMLIDVGADPNALDADGRPPLIRFYDVSRSFHDPFWPPWQDGEDEIAVVDALLRGGADPNLGTTFRGWSALHEAVARARHPVIIHLLLEAGADPYAKNSRGELPIDLAPVWLPGTNEYKRLQPPGGERR